MKFLKFVCAAVLSVAVAAEDHTTVVTIIGAGAAGISAAKVLYDEGIDFIIVEAKDTVGGRFQDTQFAGYTVEDGANWIHGPLTLNETEDDNPLWLEKLQYGIAGNYSEYNNWRFSDEDGDGVPEVLAEKWWNRIDTSLQHCTNRSLELWEQAAEEELDVAESIDISIEKCLRDYGYYNGIDSELEEDVAEVVEWAKVDFEYAELPSEISTMWGFPLNGNFEHRDFFVVDQRGYGVWMDEIAKEFPEKIMLSKTVTSIDASEENKVTIQTNDGTIIVSDYAICTLPLGVLQRGDVEFSPAFSEERLDGINGMVMANYAKIYLQFETKFWGDEEVIMTAGDPRAPNAFPWALNLDLPKYLPGCKILTFHVSNANARMIETQPIDDTINAVLEVLNKVYGSTYVSAVTATHVTNWTNNPLSYGSYSDWPLGYTEDQHNEMNAPLGRLLFGGEHTNPDSYGYGHGAIDNGRERAAEILELIYEATESLNPGASGDPHITTWSGERYDFHGICDLVLLSNQGFCNGLGLDINIRNKRLKEWSYIESAVLRIGKDVLEVAGGESNNKFWLNNVEHSVDANNNAHDEATKVTSISGYSVYFKQVSKKSREFIVKLGGKEAIVFKTWNSFLSVNLQHPTKKHFSGSVGLMGRFPSGLKVARNNVTIVSDSNVFGQEWQVMHNSEQSLFHEAKGPQYPEKCDIPSLAEMRRRLAMSDITVHDAEIACENTISKEDKELCIFDVLASNDESTAGAY